MVIKDLTIVSDWSARSQNVTCDWSAPEIKNSDTFAPKTIKNA